MAKDSKGLTPEGSQTILILSGVFGAGVTIVTGNVGWGLIAFVLFIMLMGALMIYD